MGIIGYIYITIKINHMQFPLDFTLQQNHYIGGFNYVYFRKGGGLISVHTFLDSDKYEVYDEDHMEFPQMMDFQGVQDYINQEPIRQILKVSPERFN